MKLISCKCYNINDKSSKFAFLLLKTLTKYLENLQEIMISFYVLVLNDDWGGGGGLFSHQYLCIKSGNYNCESNVLIVYSMQSG